MSIAKGMSTRFLGSEVSDTHIGEIIPMGNTHTRINKVGIIIKIETTITGAIGEYRNSTRSDSKISLILTGQIKIVLFTEGIISA